MSSSQKKELRPQALPALFASMSLHNEYFGDVSYDHIIEVDFEKGWNNREVMVFKTSSIPVGSNPVILTEVVTVLCPGIDERFFLTDIFEPFKATQIDHDKVVVEMPVASFDFLLGPKPNENFNYADEEGKFLASNVALEQYEYEVMCNQIISVDDKSSWRKKLLLKFKNEKLDFSLIDKNKRHGQIDYNFCDGPSCCVKFCVAVVIESCTKPAMSLVRIVPSMNNLLPIVVVLQVRAWVSRPFVKYYLVDYLVNCFLITVGSNREQRRRGDC